MKFAILIIFAYLLGSIPFGLIIARLHHIDLFKVGSGNIGATNLSRALGKKWAYLCFLLDVLKGAVPVIIASNLIGTQPSPPDLFLWLTVGIAAVLGHVFSIYIKFKGGKGVATSFGIAVGIYPYFIIPAAAAFAIWACAVLIWRYISLASIIASISFPLTLIITIAVKQNWHFSQLWPLLSAAILIPMMVIARHRSNIKRILDGTESKVFQKTTSPNHETPD